MPKIPGPIQKHITIHYEIDREDIEKNDDIIVFFHRNLYKVDDNSFGIPISVAPMSSPFFDDKIKFRITCHTQKQLFIGNNIKYITVCGVWIIDWIENKRENILHCQLMMVESIHDIQVVKS